MKASHFARTVMATCLTNAGFKDGALLIAQMTKSKPEDFLFL